MASVQDIINAVYRIDDDAQDVIARSAMCAQELSKHSARLQAVVRGSRSGEQAVRQVDEARRAVQDSAVCLQRLLNEGTRFIALMSQ